MHGLVLRKWLSYNAIASFLFNVSYFSYGVCCRELQHIVCVKIVRVWFYDVCCRNLAQEWRRSSVGYICKCGLWVGDTFPEAIHISIGTHLAGSRRPSCVSLVSHLQWSVEYAVRIVWFNRRKCCVTLTTRMHLVHSSKLIWSICISI